MSSPAAASFLSMRNTNNTYSNYNVLIGSDSGGIQYSIYVYRCSPFERFLAAAFEALSQHTDAEGLFRKAGSLTRQRELRVRFSYDYDMIRIGPLLI